MFNVGVDAWDFTPVTEELFGRLIDRTLPASV
jgi:calcineurin-like phosphoesterase family protein